MALIDICVPYWGDPRLMRETVESILAQDSDQWVLTVLDDAYHDTSIGEWMMTLNHPRVKYLRNEKNLGIVGNYQKLLTMTKHELVMLLGCDDVLLPNYVSTVLNAHRKHPTAAIIHPATKVIDENGREIRTLTDWAKTKLVMPKTEEFRLLEGESLAVSLLAGDWIYWPALTFNTQKLKLYQFQPELKVTHDLAIIMDMVFAGEKLLTDATVCFAYRRHSKSASTSSLFNGRRFSEERKYFAMATQLAQRAGWMRAKRAAQWHITSRANALWIALNALVKGQWGALPGLAGHVFNRVN